MPAGVARVVNCVICNTSGRSDVIKRHIRTVHAGTLPEGWTKSESKVIYKTIHPGRSMERQMGVCLDCGMMICQNHETAGDLSLFDDHVCKPKQQRSDASDTSDVSEPSEASEAPEPTNSHKELFDEIMDNIQRIKWKPANLLHKKLIVDLFRNNVTFNEEEDGTVDYKDVILQSIDELIRRSNG